MGRYWETERFNGKFAFGVQNSGDPVDFYGMYYENEPDDDDDYLVMSLYPDFENIGHTMAKVNELYDEAKVPVEKRRYLFKDNSDLMHYHITELMPYWFERSEKGQIVFSDPKVCYDERFKNAWLQYYRIHQGLAILSELLMGEECIMQAEI